MSEHRCGTIGLVGRPNTGKSSLLNRLIGQKLSIVSPKPQTTRHLLNGILTLPGCQYVFVDSPGVPGEPKNVLHRALNRRATEAARDVDVAVFVVEATRFTPEDRAALGRMPEAQTVVAAVNKIDLVRRHADLIPFLDRLAKSHPFLAVVPVSAKTGRNIPELLKVLREALPAGPPAYPEDQVTDRDERFFAAEILREKLFLLLGEELPYRCDVSLESFRDEPPKGRGKGLRRIEATIWIERDSQKPIVIGTGGELLKRVSTAARKDMERLFGGKVYLGIWVKVKRDWTGDERLLRQLGYR